MPYSVEDLCEQGIEPTMLLLLDRIQKRATVTYGEIARVLAQKLGLGQIFPTHIGMVAGMLMDRIQGSYPKAPLINTLIVNQDTGLPSEGCYGYLDDLLKSRPGTTKRMAPTAKTRLIHGIWEDVFAYQEWPAIFRGVFGHPPRPALEAGLEIFTEEDGRPVAWGGRGGGESPQHKRLKKHLFENPGVLGLQAREIKSKTTEQKLLSGDSIDVFFSSREISYIVEVKSILSSDDDIRRGIYQCLKYRSVLAAQQMKDPNDESVVATIVTERKPPSDLVELAKRLAVKIYTIRVNP